MLQKCYSIDMNHFDDIYDIASENYGIVTYSEAKEAGITSAELARWTESGRLDHLGHGVYKLVRYIPTNLDDYAEACALVGKDAFVYGESVLAMHDLALANPRTITVATPKRVRKSLPAWITVVRTDRTPHTTYEGIPAQPVVNSILTCRGTIMDERLASAADEARRRGLISSAEHLALKKEFNDAGTVVPE